MDEGEKAKVNAQAQDEAEALGVVEERESVPYTVQVSVGNGRWMDVRTVSLPPRSKRKTAIGRVEGALKTHAEAAGVSVLEVRVLDGDSCEGVPVCWQEREPELKIG